MKYLILITLIFITNHTIAFEKKGLHKLNPFPLKDFVSRSFLKYEQYSINLKQNQTTTNDINEYHGLLEQEFGYKVSDNTILSIAVNHGKSKISALRSGDTTTGSYIVSGFSEPRFSVFSRRKWAKGLGEPVIDIALSYIPSLGKKEVGSNEGNRLSGRDSYIFKVSHGTFYEFWDFNINLEYKYFDKGSEKDLVAKSTRELAGYSETEVSFEAQNYLTDEYFLRAGIGLRLITDQDQSIDNESTTVQQGTGSTHFVGLVKKSKDYVAIIKIMRQRNDYFIKSGNGNREGDYVFKTLAIEVLKDF